MIDLTVVSMITYHHPSRSIPSTSSNPNLDIFNSDNQRYLHHSKKQHTTMPTAIKSTSNTTPVFFFSHGSYHDAWRAEHTCPVLGADGTRSHASWHQARHHDGHALGVTHRRDPGRRQPVQPQEAASSVG